MPETLTMLLLLVPLLAGLACLLPPFEAEITPLSTVAALLLPVFAILLAARTPAGGPHVGLGHILLLDALSSVPILAVSGAAAIGILCSLAPLRGDTAGTARARGRTLGALHLLIFALLLALVASNLLLLWLALALAVAFAAHLVGQGGQPEGRHAARRLLLLCGCGLALALASLLFLRGAAMPALGYAAGALDWPALHRVAARLDPSLRGPASVLALLGFGTLAGLAPLHGWLPDAQRRAPAAGGIVIGVGLPCAALYALLRVYSLAESALGSGVAGRLLVAAGLISLGAAAVAIPFERHLPRLLAQAGAAWMGLIVTALGLDGTSAAGSGLLLLLFYALVGSVAIASAHALCAATHTTHLARLRGAARVLPAPGSLLVIALLALGWLPPAGAYAGVFSVLESAMTQAPALGLLLLLGCMPLTIALSALAGHLLETGGRPASGGPSPPAVPLWPLVIAVVVAVALSLHLPDGLSTLLDQAAAIARGTG